MSAKIYGLYDEARRLRYVGKTIRPLERRLKGHLYAALSGSSLHTSRGIRKMLARGFSPTIELFTETKNDWRKVEQIFIKHFKDLGYSLWNETEGGEGLVGYNHTEETKRKISNSNIGKKVSPITKAKSSIAHKELYLQRPELRAKAGNAWRGKKHTEEQKNKIGKASKGIPRPIWVKEKISDTLKDRVITPEWRRKISQTLTGRKASIETRIKLSEMRMGHSTSLETRRKIGLTKIGNKYACKN